MGLVPLVASQVSAGQVDPSGNNINLLPPMQAAYTYPNTAINMNLRASDQYMSDGAGSHSAFLTDGTKQQNPNPALWNLTWEDDLIMTGVRSFDIKAYDNALAGYGDLGWGDDLRLYLNYIERGQNFQLPNNGQNNTPGPWNVPLYLGTSSFPIPPPVTLWPPIVPQTGLSSLPGGTYYSTINQTFAHEGRMPPLVEDQRFDAQWGAASSYLPSGSTFLQTYSGNIGDDNPGIVRLRRVWDSWSTEYSKAPSSGVYPEGSSAGPLTGTPPVYPSYPAPYPAPLRGIQIQIRVTDPSNQRVKSITIRQDFTDKL